jgi:phage replication O-like protein O
MADVQLEHGHVKVANRLYEAIVDANFTAAQLKIIVVTIRLTYGWNRKAVTISHTELAELCRMQPSGGFRAALKELVDEGVILAEKGSGAHSSTFAIQKDFTQWGKFAVHPTRLAAVWDKRRPTSNIVPVPAVKGASTETPPGASTEAGSDDGLEGEGAPTGAGRVPLQGHRGSPPRGTPTGPKCETPPELQDRKDSESHGKTELNAKALSPAAGAARPKGAKKKRARRARRSISGSTSTPNGSTCRIPIRPGSDGARRSSRSR